LSTLAALAAFLITYEEWSHHYPSKREPLRYGIEAAIVAFLVFVVLTILAGAFVSRFILNGGQ
jgi:polyferredoxin